jgi:hypothetical protein
MPLARRAQQILHEQMQQRATMRREAEAAAATLAAQFQMAGVPTTIVCQLLGIGRRTLARWVAKGVITPMGSSVVGKTNRFALDDVLALRDRMMGAGQPE